MTEKRISEVTVRMSDFFTRAIKTAAHHAAPALIAAAARAH